MSLLPPSQEEQQACFKLIAGNDLDITINAVHGRISDSQMLILHRQKARGKYYFYLQVEAGSLVFVTVYTLSGRVKGNTVLWVSEGQYRLCFDASSLSNGFYILKIDGPVIHHWHRFFLVNANDK